MQDEKVGYSEDTTQSNVRSLQIDPNNIYLICLKIMNKAWENGVPNKLQQIVTKYKRMPNEKLMKSKYSNKPKLFNLNKQYVTQKKKKTEQYVLK